MFQSTITVLESGIHLNHQPIEAPSALAGRRPYFGGARSGQVLEWDLSDVDAVARTDGAAPRLEPGHGVVVFGAGARHNLAMPEWLPPTAGGAHASVVGAAGSAYRAYRLVGVTKQLGLSAPSEPLVVRDAPDAFDRHNFVRIVPPFRPGPVIDGLVFEGDYHELFDGSKVAGKDERWVTFYSALQNAGYLPPQLDRIDLTQHRGRFISTGVQAMFNDDAVLFRIETPEHLLVAWREVRAGVVGPRLFVAELPYQYLVYGQQSEGDVYRFYGAMIAQAYRARFLRRVHFDDQKGQAVPENRVPAYVPLEPPTQVRNNYWRTQVVAANRGEFTLKGKPQATPGDARLAPDNSEWLQQVVGDPFARRAPAARVEFSANNSALPIFANLYLTHQVELEGEVGFASAERCTLSFQPGFACESSASGVRVSKLTFQGVQHSLPAGGSFTSDMDPLQLGNPSSGFTKHHYRMVPLSGDEAGRFDIVLDHAKLHEVSHGCGVLALRAGTWDRCAFLDFQGTGHAIFGIPNANHTRLDDCSSNNNTGHGLFAGGSSDTNDCTWYRCNVKGNAGWGIYDSGFLGNHMLHCHAVVNGRGPYLVQDSTAYSTVVGCYSEASSIRRPSRFADNAVVLGGDHGAGFAPNSTGLLLANRASVSPLTIARKVPAGTPPYHTTESHHQRLTLGWQGSPSRGSQALLEYSSESEGAEFALRWRSQSDDGELDRGQMQRLQFLVSQGGAQGVTRSMEWCQGDVRGHGLMAFERGILLRSGGDRGRERKLVIWHGLGSPAEGVYEPGDLIINSSGIELDPEKAEHRFATAYPEGSLLRPRARFGFGPARTAGKSYRIGDTVTHDGQAYVAAAFKYPGRDGFDYVSPLHREYRLIVGVGEPSPTTAPGTVAILDLRGDRHDPHFFFRVHAFDGSVIELDGATISDEGRQARLEVLQEQLLEGDLWGRPDHELGNYRDFLFENIERLMGAELGAWHWKLVSTAETSDEPFAPVPNGHSVDGQIVWLHWGSAWTEEAATDLLDIMGQPRWHQQDFKIRTLQPHSSKEFSFRLADAQPGDRVAAFPMQPPPLGIHWHAFVAIDSARPEVGPRVYFRISNVTPEAIVVDDDLPWRFECATGRG